MSFVIVDQVRRNTAPYDAPILHFFAATGAPAIHAHGEAATEELLERLEPTPTDSILEVGCGTGHTLAVAFARYRSRLTGVDANPSMLKTCRQRLGFCRIADLVDLVHADASEVLPFPDSTFDKVYCESVLGFQPADKLASTLREIYRVIKPGGRLVANETLWLVETPNEEIAAWNERCEEYFGLMQASPSLKGPESLRDAFSESGFETRSRSMFSHPFSVREGSRSASIAGRRIERRSVLYSRMRLLASALNPILLHNRYRLRRHIRRMTPSRPLMQGWLIVGEKGAAGP